MFTTNVTKSGAKESPGAITREFVTSGYFGGLPGDPDGGKTRVVTQNNAGPTYWVGKQEPGEDGIVGMLEPAELGQFFASEDGDSAGNVANINRHIDKHLDQVGVLAATGNM